MRTKQANHRIRLLLALFVLAFAGVLARAAWLQVVKGGQLAAEARSLHSHVVKIPAGRGTIFDRTGVQLAIGEQTTTVFADPTQVRNPRAVSLYAHDLVGANANILYQQLIAKRSQKLFVQQWKNTGELNAQIEEAYSGHALVKVFGRQDESAEAFRDQNDQLYEATFKAQFNSGVMQPLMAFVSNINYVLIAVVGVVLNFVLACR